MQKNKKTFVQILSLAIAVIMVLSSVNMEVLAQAAKAPRSFLRVVFESNGGSEVEEQSAMIGNLVEKPKDPTKDGCIFDGWFADLALTDEWDFEKDVIDYDQVNPELDAIVLYAKWVVNDIEIDAAAPILTSTSANNNRAGTFAGVTVTHSALTRDNLSSVKVFYTENGSDPVVATVDGIAAPGSADTKELEGTAYYAGMMNNSTPAAEWKIVDAVCGKNYKVVVTSLSGMNQSEVASHIHRPVTPTTNCPSGAWKTGYLTNLVMNYEEGSIIHYTMGLAPVETDGTVAAENIANIPDPTTESAIYDPVAGIPLMDGRSETQAVVVKTIAAVEGYVTDVSSFYYYNQDDITMLTEARGKSEEEQLEIIDKVIDSMTLEELTSMTGGGTSQKELIPLNSGAEGRTWGIPRLGIPQNMLSDGPAGLRQKKLSTALMSWAGLASTWDVDAYEAAGELVGNEAKYYGVDIMLAPGMNIQRNPLGGRNFEYMSEDPVVTGEAASGYVRGIQSKGVGVAAKHFVANEQETNRQKGNSVVSERALREIYLAPFERVVEDDPWTIMTSYNRLNGVQTANNSWLLEDVARGEWGFTGYFMTDWGASEVGAPLIEAGNDMQQSGNSSVALQNWINEEGITVIEKNRRIERTKDAVRNILKGVIKTPSFKGEYDDLTPAIVNSRSYDFYTNPESPYAESKQKNFEIATGGIVLMKNDNEALPRTGTTRFALVSSSIARASSQKGATWSDPGTTAVYDIIIEGGGSGHVFYQDASTLKEALEERKGFSVPYAAVDTDIAANAETEAAKAVATTDVGIMVFSRAATEGSDNAVSTYALSDDERTVLEAFGTAFKAAGKSLICLINSGSAISVVEMNENADAILDVWMPGSQGPDAIAAIISGEVNPSGKLAQGFPVTYEDSPSIIMGNTDRDPVNSWGTNPVFYDEGVFVGYRYFDTFGADGVAYPFGHGLSYTTFAFSDLTLSSTTFGTEDETMTATVKVTNTGDVAGREVAEMYIGADSYKEEGRPVKELKAYAKTGVLQPGESEVVTFTIDKRDLQYYDDGEEPMGLVLSGTTDSSNVEYGKGNGWTVAEGTVFTVTVGNTSDSEVLAENGVSSRFAYGETEIPATISLNKTVLSLEEGDSATLLANVDPITSTEVPVWTSSDENIAVVNENGSVTAAGIGTATITATLSNGNSASCEVIVTKKAVDKTTLKAFIDYAQEQAALDSYKFVSKSVKERFEAALAEAKKVYSNQDATKDEVVAAKNELLKWIQALEMKEGNKGLLLDAVTTAESLNLSDYVAKGQARFKLALENAKKTYADTLASQEEINEATDELNNAMLDLRFKADTAMLENLLNKVKLLNTEVFEEKSVKALSAAVREAEAVVDAEPTQKEQSAVDEAFNNLLSAINKLLLKDSCTCVPTAPNQASSVQEPTLQITQLSKPTKLKLTAKKVTWKKVANNSGYTLKILQGKKVIKTVQLKKNKTSYKIPKKLLKKGKKYRVTLVAKGTGNYKDSKAVKSKVLKVK